MSRAKEKEEFANDDHLPRGDDYCPIHGVGDHFRCYDNPGPDIEHLAVELANIERRAA